MKTYQLAPSTTYRRGSIEFSTDDQGHISTGDPSVQRVIASELGGSEVAEAPKRKREEPDGS